MATYTGQTTGSMAGDIAAGYIVNGTYLPIGSTIGGTSTPVASSPPPSSTNTYNPPATTTSTPVVNSGTQTTSTPVTTTTPVTGSNLNQYQLPYAVYSTPDGVYVSPNYSKQESDYWRKSDFSAILGAASSALDKAYQEYYKRTPAGSTIRDAQGNVIGSTSYADIDVKRAADAYNALGGDAMRTRMQQLNNIPASQWTTQDLELIRKLVPGANVLTAEQLRQMASGQQVASNYYERDGKFVDQNAYNNIFGPADTQGTTAWYEAQVAAGTWKKVPVGGGFGYIPTGSAADTLNTAVTAARAQGRELTPEEQFQASMLGNNINEPGIVPMGPSSTPQYGTGATPTRGGSTQLGLDWARVGNDVFTVNPDGSLGSYLSEDNYNKTWAGAGLKLENIPPYQSSVSMEDLARLKAQASNIKLPSSAAKETTMDALNLLNAKTSAQLAINNWTPAQPGNGNNAYYQNENHDVFRLSDGKAVTVGNPDPTLDWDKLKLNIGFINTKDAILKNQKNAEMEQENQAMIDNLTPKMSKFDEIMQGLGMNKGVAGGYSVPKLDTDKILNDLKAQFGKKENADKITKVENSIAAINKVYGDIAVELENNPNLPSWLKARRGEFFSKQQVNQLKYYQDTLATLKEEKADIEKNIVETYQAIVDEYKTDVTNKQNAWNMLQDAQNADRDTWNNIVAQLEKTGTSFNELSAAEQNQIRSLFNDPTLADSFNAFDFHSMADRAEALEMAKINKTNNTTKTSKTTTEEHYGRKYSITRDASGNIISSQYIGDADVSNETRQGFYRDWLESNKGLYTKDELIAAFGSGVIDDSIIKLYAASKSTNQKMGARAAFAAWADNQVAPKTSTNTTASPKVGDVMMLDGRNVVITRIDPDGTFAYEEQSTPVYKPFDFGFINYNAPITKAPTSSTPNMSTQPTPSNTTQSFPAMDPNMGTPIKTNTPTSMSSPSKFFGEGGAGGFLKNYFNF